MHTRFLRPPTEQEQRVLYRYYVDELVPCLAAEGYRAPPAPS